MNYSEYLQPGYYWNRELSWLGFNQRVLSEAKDKQLPLFERLKFLSITASNLDEFFMIRVASLQDMVNADYARPDLSGMTPKEQLKAISGEAHSLVQSQYRTWKQSLLPRLREIGLDVLDSWRDLDERQKEFVDRYFEENVYPVVTPMAMDSSRPFPLIRNKSLNIGALIRRKPDLELPIKQGMDKKERKKEKLEFATVQVPAVLPRIVEIPAKEEGHRAVILLEEIIQRNMEQLFMSYDVICAHP